MKKQDKRQAILKAAMELLAEEGFHGAPMSRIAERAGVGAGTIYRYFENRDILIHEIHNALVADLMESLAKDYPVGASVSTCFFHIGKKMIDYFVRFPKKFRYSEQFHHSPYGLELRKQKLLSDSGDDNICREIYTTAYQHGVIKPLPLGVFSVLLFTPMIAAVRDYHSGLIELDERMVEMIVSSCWDSVKNRN